MKVDLARFETVVQELSHMHVTPDVRRQLRIARRYLDSAKPDPEPPRIPASPVTLIALELTP